MGCGSSSLKGDQVDVGGDAAPKPAKRVQTNFSDVDFSSGAQADRRGTMAVAPDEHRRPTKVSEVSAEGVPQAPSSPTKARASAEKAQEESTKIQPYRDIDGQEGGLGDSSVPPKAGTAPDVKKEALPTGQESTALAMSGDHGANPIKVV